MILLVEDTHTHTQNKSEPGLQGKKDLKEDLPSLNLSLV